jgi:hypothetical protein
MFGYPAFYVGRRLFACIYGDGVGLKLPGERVRSLAGEPRIRPFQPYGKQRMREWVEICHERVEAYESERPLFAEAVAFAEEREQ